MVVTRVQIPDTAISFKVIPKLDKSDIEPGEDLNLGIYLSGYRPPEKNKLHIKFSNEEVIDSDSVGKCELIELEVGPYGIKDISVKEFGLDLGGITFSIPDGVLDNHPDKPGGKGLGVIVAEDDFFPDPDGKDGRKFAPINLTLKTSEDAVPGDYKVNIVFTYEKDEEIIQEYESAEFHIKSWTERHQRKLEIFGASSALIVIISSIVNLITSSSGIL